MLLYFLQSRRQPDACITSLSGDGCAGRWPKPQASTGFLQTVVLESLQDRLGYCATARPNLTHAKTSQEGKNKLCPRGQFCLYLRLY